MNKRTLLEKIKEELPEIKDIIFRIGKRNG